MEIEKIQHSPHNTDKNKGEDIVSDFKNYYESSH